MIYMGFDPLKLSPAELDLLRIFNRHPSWPNGYFNWCQNSFKEADQTPGRKFTHPRAFTVGFCPELLWHKLEPVWYGINHSTVPEYPIKVDLRGEWIL